MNFTRLKITRASNFKKKERMKKKTKKTNGRGGRRRRRKTGGGRERKTLLLLGRLLLLLLRRRGRVIFFVSDFVGEKLFSRIVITPYRVQHSVRGVYFAVRGNTSYSNVGHNNNNMRCDHKCSAGVLTLKYNTHDAGDDAQSITQRFPPPPPPPSPSVEGYVAPGRRHAERFSSPCLRLRRVFASVCRRPSLVTTAACRAPNARRRRRVAYRRNYASVYSDVEEALRILFCHIRNEFEFRLEMQRMSTILIETKQQSLIGHGNL